MSVDGKIDPVLIEGGIPGIPGECYDLGRAGDIDPWYGGTGFEDYHFLGVKDESTGFITMLPDRLLSPSGDRNNP